MLRRVSLGLILALSACGSARVVRRDLAGGAIELVGDRGTAMEQASNEMASHCGPYNYTIVREGEEPSMMGPQRRTTAPWVVHYQCNNAAGAPQQQGPDPYQQPPADPYQQPQQPPPPPPPADVY